jgi:plasmid stabilization system protein ParE
MAYQIVLSPAARRDLRDIVRYISLDSPSRAISFGQFLLTQARKLGAFPEMGRVVPEIAEPGIREIIVRSYRVIYRLDHPDCRIEVVRFWHGARGTPDFDQP